jgi:STE24 endopeptidase
VGVSTTRAVLVLAALALASAGLLAIASRAPASLRNMRPGPGATDPSLGASFDDEMIERHGAFRRTAYASLILSIVVQIAALLILARGPIGRLVDAVGGLRGGWAVHALVVGGATAIMLTLVLLPLGFVQGYVVQHAWGLSTQDVGGWLLDRARSGAVRAVMGGVAAVAFFGVARWQPRTWWLLGWGVFTALTAALTFLWPVVVAPLFNRFTPVEDGPLRNRVLGLAREAGVTVGEVFVIDASRRSTIENAYVAGLGSSKRIVLFDTLVSSGDIDETAFIVAHELGHQVENHVVKSVALTSAGLLIGFGVLYALGRAGGIWAWAGAGGVSDLRAVPLLLLFVLVANLLSLPVENTISRAHEARADEIAVELTHDPDTGVSVFRRLAFANLADLRPAPMVVWALFSHPPIPERIRSLLAAADRAPDRT